MYAVFNIGCIECGVSSNLVSVFADRARADEVAEILDRKNEWRQGGQNAYEVFEIRAEGEIDEEYVEYLKGEGR